MEQQQLSDELTLKELVLALSDYARYFLRKWYWFVLGAAVVGGVFFYQAYTVPVSYTAPLTFLLNGDTKSTFGADAILGNLGLGGGQQGGGKVAKLIELSKSRRVISRVLFDSATVEGQQRLIANHLIELYDYHELWAENERLANFTFSSGRPAQEDRLGNSVLKALYGRAIREEEGIIATDVDEFSGLIKLTATTPKPELSIAIVEKVYNELSEYFVNASVSAKQESVRLLTVRADSIATELRAVENQLARFQDRIARIPLQQERIRAQQLQREGAILSTMYGEVIKNRETAAFVLENEKPSFEMVDGPLVPLSANREDWKTKLVIGAILGAILVGIILFLRKLFGDALQTDE